MDSPMLLGQLLVLVFWVWTPGQAQMKVRVTRGPDWSRDPKVGSEVRVSDCLMEAEIGIKVGKEVKLGLPHR